jgi:hypothetical protein
VAHIHLSNYNGKEQLLSMAPTPGAFLAELTKDQFDGLISLELGPFSLQAQDEMKLRQNLQKSLAFCQQAVMRR